MSNNGNGKQSKKVEQTYPAAQLRILAVLDKGPETGSRLVKRAKTCTRAWLSEYLGCKDSANDGWIMRAGQRTSVRKLIPSGLVKVGYRDPDNGDTLYEITASGKRLLEKQSS